MAVLSSLYLQKEDNMDQNTERILTDLRIESGAVESQIVDVWHATKKLLDIANEISPRSGTDLIREPLLESSRLISEALTKLSDVSDLLKLVHPDPLLEQLLRGDGDADGVE